jgi:hypothetical protein
MINKTRFIKPQEIRIPTAILRINARSLSFLLHASICAHTGASLHWKYPGGDPDRASRVFAVMYFCRSELSVMAQCTLSTCTVNAPDPVYTRHRNPCHNSPCSS